MIDLKGIWTKNKTVLSAVGFVLAIALIFWTVNNPAIVGVSAAQRKLPIYSVQRDDKTVAISFDAAWGNEDTQTLIDILERYQVKTTFFVVGDWVDRYPESAKALTDAGHEVMSHSARRSKTILRPAMQRSARSPGYPLFCSAAPTANMTTM